MPFDIRFKRATAVADALDDYFLAKDLFAKVSNECRENHGMVIHDIVHNEQSALDATRQTFIRALVDIQTGI